MFFGGAGEQAAVVWHRGEVVLGPLAHDFPAAVPVASIAPINAALAELCVQAVDGRDEFDTLGLGRHHHVADWTAG